MTIYRLDPLQTIVNVSWGRAASGGGGEMVFYCVVWQGWNTYTDSYGNVHALENVFGINGFPFMEAPGDATIIVDNPPPPHGLGPPYPETYAPFTSYIAARAAMAARGMIWWGDVNPSAPLPAPNPYDYLYIFLRGGYGAPPMPPVPPDGSPVSWGVVYGPLPFWF